MTAPTAKIEISAADREEMRLVTAKGVGDAQLPEKYQAAKTALEACESVDECSTWAKKAAALASYARQADDDSLEKMAMKIRARAIRRVGQLLRELPSKAGGRGKVQGGRAAAHLEKSERASTAAAAGISPAQVKQAVRVASIPEPKFEAAVEAEKPASIKQLEEQGTKKKPAPLVNIEGRDPKAFNRALQLGAAFETFADDLRATSPEAFVRGALARHVSQVLGAVEVIASWLGDFEKLRSGK